MTQHPASERDSNADDALRAFQPLQNQRFFRVLNDRLESKALQLGIEMGQMQFYCECACEHCDTMITMTLADRNATRHLPDSLALAIDHHDPQNDLILFRSEGWVVVRPGRDRECPVDLT